MFVVLIIVIAVVYLFARFTCAHCKSNACLNGKTAIVTGANEGMGYQVALNLASRGCKVIMADIANMEKSKENIIKYTNNPNIITKKIDLGCLKSVRKFAADIIESEPKLDILINNAGIGLFSKNRTDDGLHPLMQINYFGHFLLTHLLIDLLKKSAPSRIIFTSSLLCFVNNLNVDNLNYDEEQVTPEIWRKLYKYFMYGNSKLALIIASDMLAKKLEESGVTCNCVHPGVVATSIFSNTVYPNVNFLGKVFTEANIFLWAKSAWEGAQTIIHAAVSTELQNVSGKFFLDCRPFLKPASAYDKNFCEKIFQLSEKCVGLKNHEKL